MSFLYRLGFYLGGFSIGLVFLFFILNGKRTQCNYGPQARVINDLSKKEWMDKPNRFLEDTLAFSQFLKGASVNFNQSNTRLEKCKQYQLEGYFKSEALKMRVENCEETVRILHFETKN